jgi:hypothetical protein
MNARTTALNAAYAAGAAQAVSDFEKEAAVAPNRAASFGSLGLGSILGAASVPYLDEDYDDYSGAGKVFGMLQGGLLGGTGALTGHGRFGIPGALGGAALGVGTNIGLSRLAPEGDGALDQAARIGIEAAKSSIGGSLLANSLFRGGAVRDVMDEKMRNLLMESQLDSVRKADGIRVSNASKALGDLLSGSGNRYDYEIPEHIFTSKGGKFTLDKEFGGRMRPVRLYDAADEAELEALYPGNTGRVNEAIEEYRNLSPEAQKAAIERAIAKPAADSLYDNLYQDFLMGPIDEGGPGSWVAKLRGSRPGAVSKAFDYWLGSPEIAQLIKDSGGKLYDVPTGKYLAAMGKDIGVGAGVGSLAAVPGLAYTAATDYLDPEPWYNEVLPFRIEPK